jgi:hypothetical protein
VVRYNVENMYEGLIDDNDYYFTWYESDPMNGMTRCRTSDFEKGVVFDVNEGADNYLEWEIIASERDFSDDAYLSFRACQGTRHPLTVAELGDLAWHVYLKDGDGYYSVINFASYLGGVEEPYQRTGAGTGAGWQNEFETIRIRLTDFLTNGSPIDLMNIVAVGFHFGADETLFGRIGLDDLEVTKD